MPLNNQVISYYERADYIKARKQYSEKEYESRKKIMGLFEKSGYVLEIGCGNSTVANMHPNYIGTDLSKTALKKMKGNRVRCDAQHLPFKGNSISGFVSFYTLEHIEMPDKVLDEVDRVLRKNGIAIFSDAWDKTHGWFDKIKPYQNLSFKQKEIIRLATGLFFKRLWDEVFSQFKKIPLKYIPVKPDYTKICSDCDAVSSIDPHNLLLWFKSRNYKAINEFKNIILRCCIVSRPVTALDKRYIAVVKKEEVKK